MMVMTALLALIAQAPQLPRPQCTAENAVVTTIADIQREPDRYLDRCVNVTGLFSGIRLYSSREGIYLVNRFGPDGNSTVANLRHRIGADNQEMRNLRLQQPVPATVIGWVDSCERRSRRVVDAGGIPFLTGYCHYHDGPTIIVQHYRLGRGGFERLTGEASRQRFGNIAPIPDDWPHRRALEAMAADFLGALRSGDRARMAALHDIRPNTTHAHDSRMLALLLDDPNSPFAELRRRDTPQTLILTTTRDGRPFAGDDNDGVSGILCFCRAEDCSGRWPIAQFDADNAPARPYACTIVEPRDWSARGAGLNTPIGSTGFLAEPARTVFRR